MRWGEQLQRWRGAWELEPFCQGQFRASNGDIHADTGELNPGKTGLHPETEAHIQSLGWPDLEDEAVVRDVFRHD